MVGCTKQWWWGWGLIGGVVHWFVPINLDVGLHVHYVQEIFAGKVLYHDLFEINPPLIVYLTMVPVWFASVLDCSPLLMMHFANFFVVGLACFLSWGLLRESTSDSTVLSIVAHAMGFAAFVFPFTMFFGEFGQKEHLFIWLSMPYVLQHLLPRDSVSTSRRLLIGVMAGFGCALKPFFVLLPLCLELVAVVRTKKVATILRVDLVVLIGLLLLYFASVLVFFPEYYETVIPLASVSHPASYLGLEVVPYAIRLVTDDLSPLLPFVLLGLIAWKWLPERRLAALMLVCFAVLFVVAVIQGKGWDYHSYPAAVFGIVFSALYFCGIWRAYRAKQISDILDRFFLAIALLLVVPVSSLLIYRLWSLTSGHKAEFHYGISQFRSELAELRGEHVLYVHNTFFPVIPLTYELGFIFNPKVTFTNLLDGVDLYRQRTSALPPEKAEQQHKAIDYYLDSLEDYIHDNAPAVLIIDQSKDRSCTGEICFETPDYWRYFNKRKRLSALLQRYEHTNTIVARSGEVRFAVYRKRVGWLRRSAFT